MNALLLLHVENNNQSLISLMLLMWMQAHAQQFNSNSLKYASSSLIFTLELYEHQHLPSSCCFFTPPSTPSLCLLKISVLRGRNALIRCLSGLGSLSLVRN